MNDPRLESLHSFLKALAPLPDSEWDALAHTLHPSTLQTGEALLRIGEPPFKAAYVYRGLLKSYYLTSRGEEYIRGFSMEGTLVVAMASILEGRPGSDINVVALEPTEIVEVDYRAYQALIPRHWTWQQIGRLLVERAYVLRERRQTELLTMNAEQRIEAFKNQFPGLMARISQKDLAGYVGITPVSLSRLRAKKKGRGD
jgi:CRP-like cAMP-binding protein